MTLVAELFLCDLTVITPHEDGTYETQTFGHNGKGAPEAVDIVLVYNGLSTFTETGENNFLCERKKNICRK